MLIAGRTYNLPSNKLNEQKGELEFIIRIDNPLDEVFLDMQFSETRIKLCTIDNDLKFNYWNFHEGIRTASLNVILFKSNILQIRLIWSDNLNTMHINIENTNPIKVDAIQDMGTVKKRANGDLFIIENSQQMKRKAKIIQTIDYCWQKSQKIYEDMKKEIKTGEKIQFLDNQIANFFSDLNKCYDWCLKDIIENQILPYASQNDVNKIKNKRLYFPMSSKIFNDDRYKWIYDNLKKNNINLYIYLNDIANKIDKETETVKNNAIFNYKLIHDIRKICNNDKHETLIELNTIDNDSVIIRGKKVGINLPNSANEDFDLEFSLIQRPQNVELKLSKKILKDGNCNDTKLYYSKDGKLTEGPTYLLKYNKIDVEHFCNYAQTFTYLIINEIYSRFK